MKNKELNETLENGLTEASAEIDSVSNALLVLSAYLGGDCDRLNSEIMRSAVISYASHLTRICGTLDELIREVWRDDKSR